MEGGASRKPGWAAILLSLTLASCTQAPDRPTPTATIDTLPNGLVRVANSGEPGWGEGGAWRLEEELRLGLVDGEEAEVFGQVQAIQVDERGRIFVLDSQAQEIRVFLPDGTYAHTIGRRGEGPGEFDGAWELDFATDGRLWVTDLMAPSFVVFDPGGEFLEAHPRDPALTVIIPRPGTRMTRSHGLINWTTHSPPAEERRAGMRVVRHFIPVRFTPPATYDTFPSLEDYREVASNGRGYRPEGGLVWHTGRDGALWFADADEYLVHRRTLEGDTTLVFSLSAPPLLWTRAERDSIIELSGPPGSRYALTDDDIPETKPIVRAIFDDGAGHLYVIPQLDGVPDGTGLDVFRDSGEYLGRLSLPERINYYLVLPVATATHLYAVVLDDLDVARIVRWRIVRP